MKTRFRFGLEQSSCTLVGLRSPKAAGFMVLASPTGAILSRPSQIVSLPSCDCFLFLDLVSVSFLPKTRSKRVAHCAGEYAYTSAAARSKYDFHFPG